MIKKIHAGPGLAIIGDSNGYMAETGVVRWNGMVQQFEIMYGDRNIPIYQGDLHLGFDGRTEKLLDWAEKKMNEEAIINELCDKYPILAKSRKDFEILYALIRNYSEK